MRPSLLLLAAWSVTDVRGFLVPLPATASPWTPPSALQPCATRGSLTIQYGDLVVGRDAENTYVPKRLAEDAPEYTITGDGWFSVMMVDMDAPSPANASHAPFLHYLVANVAAAHETPTIVTSYFPVLPPTGTHRYVTLLLQQRHYAAHAELSFYLESSHRSNFDMVGYAAQHHLCVADTRLFTSSP
ncbi:hypothetical protein SPRG_06485 [Saprolegnia parasitica CBS 223.65]|uniref:Phosphatidylethanolamine-binding protein n=1 Tax=Saprolegnia parasitica (strain CBS 223.65) TaxID=695850 RepID=A0A067CHH0_SAPPC|nr:hypothetical protein SPRG_06485 [Saprolegnia parasitica CBS 223.65]KDO28630.1 hypothetical protein SPRG_06485 [Saprolegnia parasitica CBS 223.65]|eukprot:XP_012200692.1 hypothetical protein SPRG_06485 [Saprolegnia parasitica CBS 223.65]